MIIFPDLNSVKITKKQSSNVAYYRNTLYQDLNRGVSQCTANTKIVDSAIFTAFQSITFQMWIPVSQSVNVVINTIVNDVQISYGTVTTPLNGASASLIITSASYYVYNFTIPYQEVGRGYIYISDQINDEEYYSETFCVSEYSSISELGDNVLSLDYTSVLGLKNGYYWSGETQKLTINCGEYEEAELEPEMEISESLKKEITILDSSSLRTDYYVLKNIPFYLYAKLISASLLDDLKVNGEYMTFVSAEKEDQRDGKVDFKLIYKEKNVTNIF